MPLTPPRIDGDCYRLDAHRQAWREVSWCFGLRRRWVCPVCYPEGFA